DLVRAGVGEVLPLQEHAIPGLLGQVPGVGERRGPPHVVGEQRGELRAELAVVTQLEPRVGQLLEGRDQDLGDVPAAELAEPSAFLLDLELRRHHGSVSCAEMPVTGASSPRSWRSFAAGFLARIRDSPTRIACAPASSARSTCARVEMALSNTTVRS